MSLRVVPLNDEGRKTQSRKKKRKEKKKKDKRESDSEREREEGREAYFTKKGAITRKGVPFIDQK